MVKINLERRAEIGRAKRARTRAAIIAAACALLSTRPWAAITVDDLVLEAGVAKGTFYVHFEDLEALARVVADEFVGSIMQEVIGPLRVATAEPLLRTALGCYVFLGRALTEPAWGSLVARMVRSDPRVGEFAQKELREDIRDVLKSRAAPPVSVEAVAQAVLGIVLQSLAAIGSGTLGVGDLDDMIRAIMGAIGIPRNEREAILRTLHRRAAASAA